MNHLIDNDISSIKLKLDYLFTTITLLPQSDRNDIYNFILKYLNKQSTYQIVIKGKKCRRAKKTEETSRCEMCNLLCYNSSNLFKHLEIHNGTPKSCILCRRTFKNDYSFNFHKSHLCNGKNEEELKSNKCPRCSKRFMFEKHLKIHLQGHKRNDCKSCGAFLSKKKDLVNHMYKNHDIKSRRRLLYNCEYCSKPFVKARSLFIHLKRHQPQKIICLECGHGSDTNEENIQHMKNHRKQKFTECPKCKEKFSQSHLFRIHLKNHDKYKCVTCKQDFGSRAQALIHKKLEHIVEGLEPTFLCPYCLKRFSRTLLLNRHMVQHNVVQTVITCKLCNITFNTNEDYYKHCITTPHNVQKRINSLVCEACGKQFEKKYILMEHVRNAHEGKPLIYSCTYCNYKTQIRPNLHRHIKLHFTTEKQFICDNCGKTFRSFATLKDHVSYTHIQDKQFNCQDCTKTFKRKSELNRHKSTHSTERPYECKLCKQSYKRLAHLRRHEETAHKVFGNTKRIQRLQKDNNGKICPVPKATENIERKKEEQQYIISFLEATNLMDLQQNHTQIFSINNLLN